MLANSSRRKTRLFPVPAICLIVLAAFAVRPAKILYHNDRMRRAWANTFEPGRTNSQDIIKFEAHRDALVALGYMVKRVFPLDHIKPGSPEHKALHQELNQNSLKASGYFFMQGFEASTPPVVIVWATTAHLPEWEAIIKSHQPKPSPQ
jgi:hypothetical protein